MICKYSGICVSSNFGEDDICSTDPESCKNYWMFEKVAKIKEALPRGAMYHEKDRGYSENLLMSKGFLTIKKRLRHPRISSDITPMDITKKLIDDLTLSKKK